MKMLGIVLVPVVLVVIGLVSLAAGVVNYTQEEHFFATATQATGTITEYGFVNRGQYCALLVFQDTEGQRQEYVNTSDCVSNAKDQGHIGQQVTIYYDPADPSRTAQMRGLGQMEGSGLIIGIVAFTILTVTGLFVFLATFFARQRSAARASRTAGI
jgi:hypothetical protein